MFRMSDVNDDEDQGLGAVADAVDGEREHLPDRTS